MSLSQLVSTAADSPEPSTRSLAGRRVLVTGGAHRIGRRICLDLAHAGARVTFSWLSAERQARTTLAELQAIDAGASAVRCDVTRLRDVRSLRDHLHRRETVWTSASTPPVPGSLMRSPWRTMHPGIA